MKKNLRKFLIAVFFIVIILKFALSVFAEDILIKKPNVSGAFYPGDAADLSTMIKSFFDNVSEAYTEEKVCALISPHAGYIYSGQAAAYGYKKASKFKYKTIIILSPTHYFKFNKAAVFKGDFFKTPLGDVPLDNDFIEELIKQDKDIIELNSVFEKEHALEVQIPFLQEAFKDFSIVPVIVSSNSYVLCEKLADALVKIIGKRNDVLVIASSDMSHYHALDLAKEIDKATLALIENNETEELFNFCAYGKGELCGLGAVTTLMLAMKQLNASKIELLRYATSANTAGSDINRVVGYCSVVFSNEINSDKNPIKRGENMLSNEQRKKILEVARQSMTEYLKTGKRPKTTTTDPLFQELRGAFVTIHKNGALRGCIGRIIADKPLVEVIEDMAIQAATQDPRFPVLETKELEDIDLEISVLTPLKEIDDIKKIEVGKHGLLIRKGFFSGLLLPQVATEYGWTKEEFLEHTCLKAGLEPQAWKNGAQIYIFSAEVFGEKGN